MEPERRKRIGCLELQVFFRERTTIYMALWREIPRILLTHFLSHYGNGKRVERTLKHPATPCHTPQTPQHNATHCNARRHTTTHTATHTNKHPTKFEGVITPPRCSFFGGGHTPFPHAYINVYIHLYSYTCRYMYIYIHIYIWGGYES